MHCPRGRAHRDRERHRRCPARERIRSADVAEHADRVRRCLRLHGGRLPSVVRAGVIQALRPHPFGRTGRCGCGIQVTVIAGSRARPVLVFLTWSFSR
jgi:hypothetical protein